MNKLNFPRELYYTSSTKTRRTKGWTYSHLNGLCWEYSFLCHSIGFIYLSNLMLQRCHLRTDWQRIPLRQILSLVIVLEDLLSVFMVTTLLQQQEVVK